PVAIIVVVSLLFALWNWIACRRHEASIGSSLGWRLMTSLALGVFALGVVAAVYLALLPVSLSIAGYLANTHHLVYATLTNITGGGFLENAHLSPRETLVKILDLHARMSPLAGINVLYFVGVAMACAMARAVRNRRYLLGPALFLTGF